MQVNTGQTVESPFTSGLVVCHHILHPVAYTLNSFSITLLRTTKEGICNKVSLVRPGVYKNIQYIIVKAQLVFWVDKLSGATMCHEVISTSHSRHI